VRHRGEPRCLGEWGRRLEWGSHRRREWRTAAARVEARVRAGSDRGGFIWALVMVGKTFGRRLDVARRHARLGQGPRAWSFNFQEILGGSLAIHMLINTHVKSWF
jgi:hypothetical protein